MVRSPLAPLLEDPPPDCLLATPPDKIACAAARACNTLESGPSVLVARFLAAAPPSTMGDKSAGCTLDVADANGKPALAAVAPSRLGSLGILYIQRSYGVVPGVGCPAAGGGASSDVDDLSVTGGAGPPTCASSAASMTASCARGLTAMAFASESDWVGVVFSTVGKKDDSGGPVAAVVVCKMADGSKTRESFVAVGTTRELTAMARVVCAAAFVAVVSTRELTA